jgi:hypothetical protein
LIRDRSFAAMRRPHRGGGKLSGRQTAIARWNPVISMHWAVPSVQNVQQSFCQEPILKTIARENNRQERIALGNGPDQAASAL